MTAVTVDQKVDTLIRDLQTLIPEASKQEATRKKLYGSTLGLMAQVEAPVETIWRMIMSPHAPAALNVILRMGAVSRLVNSGPQTAEELGEACDADPGLIVRLMRPLTALGVFKEVGVQKYASTPIAEILTAPPLTGGYQFMFECATRSLALMPTYLEKNNYQNVTSSPGPFEYSHGTKDGMFSYLNKDPSMMGNFNAFMAGSLETRKSWLSWFESFPVDTILLSEASKSTDDVLLIDIGGGEGHDIEAFHRAFRRTPGRLILQDLPPTIDHIQQLSSSIERQKYDFFTPQPVRGARCYYFRNIFHDWPDREVITILRNTASAMKPGYSKMLIFEWVLPPTGVPLYPALLDVNMMAVLNGQERTRQQWDHLLHSAGLRAIKYWATAPDAEGLIEVEQQ